MAGGLVEDGQRRSPRGGNRGEAGRQAGKGHRAARGGRAEDGAPRRGPDRLVPVTRTGPADRQWSRKHADTQRRLCERFAAPVIGSVPARKSRLADMQRVVNAAPTAKEGERVRRMISALVTAGIEGGYLASRAAGQGALASWGPPAARAAGERCGRIRAVGRPRRDSRPRGRGRARPGRLAVLHGDRDELMANTAAYSGLRWGELTALTIGQIDTATRVITVDRKVIEVAGQMYLEAPKNRKQRRDNLSAHHPRWLSAGRAARRPRSGRPAPSRRPAPTRWD